MSLTVFHCSSNRILLLGDFNIHRDDPFNDPDSPLQLLHFQWFLPSLHFSYPSPTIMLYIGSWAAAVRSLTSWLQASPSLQPKSPAFSSDATAITSTLAKQLDYWFHLLFYCSLTHSMSSVPVFPQWYPTIRYDNQSSYILKSNFLSYCFILFWGRTQQSWLNLTLFLFNAYWRKIINMLTGSHFKFKTSIYASIYVAPRKTLTIFL